VKRKRAPGAGRPPRGEFRGKSATITTRIKPETRLALEDAARAHRRSLSQEIERRLRESLSSSERSSLSGERQPPHIRAIGELAKIATERIEVVTDKDWLRDAFTAEAVRHTIDQVLSHFAPPRQASHTVPDQIERLSAAMPSDLADAYRRPIALALMQATSITAWIESAHRIEPPNEWSDPSDPISLRQQLYRDLGAKKEGRK
jgi:hypothetical protein